MLVSLYQLNFIKPSVMNNNYSFTFIIVPDLIVKSGKDDIFVISLLRNQFLYIFQRRRGLAHSVTV